MYAKGAMHFLHAGRISKATASLSSLPCGRVFGRGRVHGFAESLFKMSP